MINTPFDAFACRFQWSHAFVLLQPHLIADGFVCVCVSPNWFTVRKLNAECRSICQMPCLCTCMALILSLSRPFGIP